MSLERPGAVLGEDVNLTDAGVDAIAEREIDEAELTGKRNGGFGPFFGQRLESFADTTGHEENNGSLHLNHLLPVTG
jgi:hypothetical protein